MAEVEWEGVIVDCSYSPEGTIKTVEKPSQYVQCPFCRSTASGLALRSVVDSKEVARDAYEDIKTRTGERCVGRNGGCYRKLQDEMYVCAECPQHKLCRRCFHAFDHSEHPFIRVSSKDTPPEVDLRRSEDTHYKADKLNRLLSRLNMNDIIAHIERVHGKTTGGARCTACKTKKHLSPCEMIHHFKSHHTERNADRYYLTLLPVKASLGTLTQYVVCADAHQRRHEMDKTTRHQIALQQQDYTCSVCNESILFGDVQVFTCLHICHVRCSPTAPSLPCIDCSGSD